MDTELPLLTDERRERDGPHWPDRTLLSYLDEAVEATPEKTAIIGPRRSYTFAELDEVSDRVAAAMSAHGIGKGDVVSIQLPNWAEAVPTRLAVMKLGAVAHPLPDFFRAGDVEYMIDLLEPSAFVVAREFDGHDFVSMLRETLSFEGRVYTVPPDPDTGTERDDHTPFAELTAHDRATDYPGLDPMEDISHVLFTGGTTGKPKGVLHTENTTVSWAAPYSDRTNYGSDSRNLVTSTIGHGAGYMWATYLPIVNGSCAVFMDEWSGADGLRHIEEYDITHLYVIPTFIHDMLAADPIDEADVSSLENISCGGATVPRAMVKNAREILGCSVCAGWGQTEDWLTTLTDPADSDEKINETDGYPMDGMEIKIEDPEDRYPGETGQLLVRGPWLMMGFYRRPDALEERMRGSWYVTGDLAKIDDDGYLSITGREEDIIIRGGENVPVDVIEDLLYDHPKIDEAAVVAMPDDRLGERACAFVTVVPGETFTMKDLVAYLEDQDLTKQYFPEQMQLVDELPKTSLGKIDRLMLREQIADILGKDPV